MDEPYSNGIQTKGFLLFLYIFLLYIILHNPDKVVRKRQKEEAKSKEQQSKTL